LAFSITTEPTSYTKTGLALFAVVMAGGGVVAGRVGVAVGLGVAVGVSARAGGRNRLGEQVIAKVIKTKVTNL
jgi:hypothetical protein